MVVSTFSPRHLRIFDATVSGIAFRNFIFYVCSWYTEKNFLHNDLVCRDLVKFTNSNYLYILQNFLCTKSCHRQIKVLQVLPNPYAF